MVLTATQTTISPMNRSTMEKKRKGLTKLKKLGIPIQAIFRLSKPVQETNGRII